MLKRLWYSRYALALILFGFGSAAVLIEYANVFQSYSIAVRVIIISIIALVGVLLAFLDRGVGPCPVNHKDTNN